MKKFLLVSVLTISFNFSASFHNAFFSGMENAARFPVLIHYFAVVDTSNIGDSQKLSIKDFIGEYLFREQWVLKNLRELENLIAFQKEIEKFEKMELEKIETIKKFNCLLHVRFELKFVENSLSLSNNILCRKVMHKARLKNRHDVVAFMQAHSMDVENSGV